MIEMGAKTRKRPRDLSHPKKTPKPTHLDEHGKRVRPDFNGSWSRPTQAKTGRVPGTNGSWPAASGAAADGKPRPPAICMFAEDIADPTQSEPEAVFGQYPASFITKMLPSLDVGMDRRKILHVCSGSLRKGEGIRVDVRPEAKPDIVADGRALPLAAGSVAAVMLDPPYTAQYAQDLYGIEYPLPAHLLEEAARVVRPGGVIAFVHYLVPMPPPGTTWEKTFGMSMGFGFPMRAVTIYRKHQEQLPLRLET